ncbi:uncharacterized protein LOC107878192 [Capsicum annuum]|uniref:uncharacterized protein LOC107878192 n=1 Tax=Capsicum annuum TaxID=4072 RepID=UPI001FB093C8|nr:uncharacterized protein LOC107878192 [Capsicum annuum]
MKGISVNHKIYWVCPLSLVSTFSHTIYEHSTTHESFLCFTNFPSLFQFYFFLSKYLPTKNTSSTISGYFVKKAISLQPFVLCRLLFLYVIDHLHFGTPCK